MARGKTYSHRLQPIRLHGWQLLLINEAADADNRNVSDWARVVLTEAATRQLGAEGSNGRQGTHAGES